MEFTTVEKTVKQDLYGIVKLQLVTYCCLKDISLNKTELACLTLLGCKGQMLLREFLQLIVDVQIVGSTSAANNCLSILSRSGLFVKEGGGKKRVYLHPDLQVQREGNIMLNYKFYTLEETGTLEQSTSRHSAATSLT